MKESQLIYGLHSVLAVLEQDPVQVKQVWLDKGRRDKRGKLIESAANKAGVPLTRINREELDSRAGTDRHQGVVAEVSGGSLGDERGLFALLESRTDPALLLILDGVQDPHNLGACLRTADAAGVDAVVVPRDQACGLTPTVRKVAAGAAETMPLFQVTNLSRALKKLQEAGIWVVGADAEAGQSLFTSRLVGPLAMVLGAEGTGLRRLTRETCDELVALPMRGQVASLNVSVAVGVCLYEVVRQRASD